MRFLLLCVWCRTFVYANAYASRLCFLQELDLQRLDLGVFRREAEDYGFVHAASAEARATAVSDSLFIFLFVVFGTSLTHEGWAPFDKDTKGIWNRAFDEAQKYALDMFTRTPGAHPVPRMARENVGYTSAADTSPGSLPCGTVVWTILEEYPVCFLEAFVTSVVVRG